MTTNSAQEDMKDSFRSSIDHPLSFSKPACDVPSISKRPTYNVSNRFANLNLGEEENANEYLVQFEAALMRGDLELAKQLWERTDLQSVSLEEFSWMETAIEARQIPAVEFLIERGVSVNTRNNLGQTPLHIAADLGCSELIEFLCKSGADIYAVDQMGNTPLHQACLNERPKVVLVLSAGGADIDARNYAWNTPLLVAVHAGNIACARALLSAGARYDLPDEDGNTPLHIACANGDHALVHLLCTVSLGVDIFNLAGFTPLHLAAKGGYAKCVRYLLLAGADPQLPNKNGIAPDIMAFAQQQKKVGMLLTKMKPERHKMWVSQLVNANHLLPRIKLKIFGSTLVGKTRLAQSIKAGFISGYLRKKLSSVTEITGLNTDQVLPSQSTRKYLPYDWNMDAQHLNYTRGIAVETTSDFSLWDFSGYEPYFFFYDHFIGDMNCVHLILFSLLDTREWRRASLRFWLDFLYSRLPVTEPLLRGGKSSRLAQIVIIATHADCVQCLRDNSGLYYDEDALRLVRELRDEYALKLDISDTVYVLDARDATSVEIRQLKTYLGHCRNSLLQSLPRTNGLLIEVANQLPEWCVDDPFPVDTWSQFADRVRERVNPLCTEEHLLTLVQHLQYTGNLVYVESPSNDDMIALNPNWLCENILGACISEEALHNIRVTGSFTMDDFQLLVCSEHTTQVISILEAFGVCVCCVVTEQQPKQSKRHRVGKKARSLKGMDFFQEATSPKRSERDRTRGRAVSFHVATRSALVVSQFDDWDNIQLEAPRHNLIEMYPGLWDPPADASLYTYGGLELSASPGQFMHLMPRIQLQLRRDIAKMMEDVCVDSDNHAVPESSQNWELTQWLHGSKVTVRESAIEILIKWHQSRQGILLITRCFPRYSRKAFWLLHNIVQLTCQVIDMVCPSLEFEANVLCSSDVARHDPDPGICDSNILVDHLMRLGKKAFYESERLDLEIESQCMGGISTSDDLVESTFYSQVADELPSDGRPGTSRMVLRDILLFNQKLAICVAQCYQQPLSSLRMPVIQHLARVLDVADQTKEVWIRFASHLNIPYSEETLDKLLSEQDSPIPPSLTGIALRTASKDASNSIGTLMIALRSIHCFDLIHYLHHAQLLLMFGTQTQPQQRCQPTERTTIQQQPQSRNHDFESLRAEDDGGQMV